MTSRTVEKRRWDGHGSETTVSLLAHAARTWPDKIFIEHDGAHLTFRAFDERSTAVARSLADLGVRPGDTVCALLHTGIEHALYWLAANKAGAIYVPLNTALKGDLLAHQLTDADAAVILAHSSFVERVLAVREHLRADVRIFSDHAERKGDAPVFPLSDLTVASSDSKLAEVAPTDLSLILYTSGTSGPSKGCMASHEYATHIADRISARYAMAPADVVWSPLPLFHIFGTCGVVLAAMRVGAQVSLNRKFSVSNFWPEVERTGATILNVVGSMIPLIGGAPDNEHQKRCHGQVRAAVGIPFSPEEIGRWKARFGIQWIGNAGYGLTEAGGICELGLQDDPITSASGRSFDFDVRIFDDNDRELDSGAVGEIVVRPLRPGAMFDGYWRRPLDTLKTMGGLWFHTGDLGKLDENGYLTFVDRKKDYMRVGGENVSSYELEKTFACHPSIHEVAAYSVPSKLSEDEIKLSVVLTPGAAVTEEDICRWSVDRLPYFSVPHHIEIHWDLPRSPTGKILKFMLREAGLTAATWSRSRSAMVLERV